MTVRTTPLCSFMQGFHENGGFSNAFFKKAGISKKEVEFKMEKKVANSINFLKKDALYKALVKEDKEKLEQLVNDYFCNSGNESNTVLMYKLEYSLLSMNLLNVIKII